MLAFGISVLLYIAARTWPAANDFFSTWAFDPLAWQLLFVSGVSLGAAAAVGTAVPRTRALLVLAVAYLGWALWAAIAAWGYDGSWLGLPPVIRALLFPVMDRTNLSLWRFAHVLALAYAVTYFMAADHAVLRSRPARPFVLMGQHSLTLFCAGVVLSVLGWALLSQFGDGLAMHVVVNAGGLVVMALVAWLLAPPMSV
jgi:hypothetical protein